MEPLADFCVNVLLRECIKGSRDISRREYPESISDPPRNTASEKGGQLGTESLKLRARSLFVDLVWISQKLSGS